MTDWELIVTCCYTTGARGLSATSLNSLTEFDTQVLLGDLPELLGVILRTECRIVSEQAQRAMSGAKTYMRIQVFGGLVVNGSIEEERAIAGHNRGRESTEHRPRKES